MEGRKVQRVGHSTITVSLPTEWVKRNNINAGDLVFVIPEKDWALRIIPSRMAQRQEVEEYVVDADQCDQTGMLERIIVGSYMLGRDLVRVTSSSRIERKHINEVRGIIRKLIGLGILEETPKEILLQCSLDPTKFKLDVLIKRLSAIASTILSESVQALVENRTALAEEAISREDEADMIYYLAVRLLLSAQVNPDIAQGLGMTNMLFIPSTRLMLQYLELIADYSEDIGKNIIELESYRDKLPLDSIKRIRALSVSAQTIFLRAVDCSFTRDLKVANELLEMRNALEIESNRFIEEAPEIPFLRAIVSTLDKIADKGATIADVSIDEALEEPGKEVESIIRVVKHVGASSAPSKK